MPPVILHGCQDTLIPPHHSAKLWEVVGGGCPGPPQGTELLDADVTHTRSHGAAQLAQWLRLAKNADHNSWEYEQDILLPVVSFTHEVVERRGRFCTAEPPNEMDVTPYLYAQRGRAWGGRHDSRSSFLCLGATRPAPRH